MQLLLKAATLLLASSEALALASNTPTELTVNVKNGTVIGKYVDSYAQEQFLGIPFAQPPLGDLRFNMPKPLNETWETALDATEYGPICPNYPLPFSVNRKDITYTQSEDCLTLNVVRPAGTKPDDRLPVLVWIYGGGFQEGGSADGRYNTSYLVQNSVQMDQPTIVVSMNYRVHGWGFLAGNDVRGQGLLNVGLHDQRVALQWVQDNIEAFGGDRRKVTIQGESAGALSVGYHILAYGGRDDGLFQGAICQSGGPWYFGSYSSDEELEKTYQTVLEATDCTDSHDTLACLRAAPFDTLNTTFAQLSFLPAIDGSLVPEYNSVALDQGKFVKVPLLIGANTDEGKIFAGYGVNTTDEFISFIQNYEYTRTTNNETIEQIIEAYPYPGLNSTNGQSDDTVIPPTPYGAQFSRTARYLGDLFYIAGRRYACELWAKHGLPCYSYRFNTIPADTDALTLGATHLEDIAFVFSNFLGTGMDSSAFNVSPSTRQERYKELSRLMSRMWLSFTGTYSPNNHNLDSFKTVWPQYRLDAPQNMVFDGNSTSFVEKDNWRANALKLIIDSALDFSR